MIHFQGEIGEFWSLISPQRNARWTSRRQIVEGGYTKRRVSGQNDGQSCQKDDIKMIAFWGWKGSEDSFA